MEREEALEVCRAENKRLLEQYHKGRMTGDELCQSRNSFLHRMNIQENFDRETFDEMLAACGLKKVAETYYPLDLGFTPLMNGGLYVFKNLRNTESLYFMQDAAGKTVHLGMQLQNGEELLDSNLEFQVTQQNTPEDTMKGWREYVGYGTFIGYHGEGSLYLKEQDGMMQSILYQKCYRNESDPVWQRRKKELVTGYVYVNQEESI